MHALVDTIKCVNSFLKTIRSKSLLSFSPQRVVNRVLTMQRDLDLEQSIRDAKFYLEEAHSACVTSNYPIAAVSWAGKTAYCSELVIATNEEYGNMLITDKELQSTQVDEAIYHEHLVHPAILAYRTLYGEKPLRILVLGVCSRFVGLRVCRG